MFNRKKNERIRQLEQQVETLKDQNQRLWDRINDAATLISIERVGREIFFTYKRQGEVFDISTYATTSDDVAAWRKQTGLK